MDQRVRRRARLRPYARVVQAMGQATGFLEEQVSAASLGNKDWSCPDGLTGTQRHAHVDLGGLWAPGLTSQLGEAPGDFGVDVPRRVFPRIDSTRQ